MQKSPQRSSVPTPKIQNLTHTTVLSKIDPKSTLPASIENAQNNIAEYESRLRHDGLIPPMLKLLKLNEYAAKQAEQFLPVIDASAEPLQTKLAGYDSRVNEMLTQRNAMDSMILGQTATGLIAAEFNLSKLMKLAENDPDVARTVLVNPTMKFSLNLDDKSKEYFTDQVRRHTLGDDYQNRLDTIAHVKSLNSLGGGLLDAFVQHTNNAKSIASQRAIEPTAPTGE